MPLLSSLSLSFLLSVWLLSFEAFECFRYVSRAFAYALIPALSNLSDDSEVSCGMLWLLCVVVMSLHDCALYQETFFASFDMRHGLKIGKGRSSDQFLLFGKVDFMNSSHNYIQPRYEHKGVQSPSDHSCEAMSHVVPDLVQKILKGQKPFLAVKHCPGETKKQS